jgi:hypothetical protein
MPSITAFLSARCLTRTAVLASLGVASVPSGARAQSNAFTACTQGAMANCALLELSAGIDAGGAFFQIAIQNLGSSNPLLSATLPTSIYNLVFDNGQAPGSGTDIHPIVPTAVGGATVPLGTDWDLFHDGATIFLSALDNHGVGGCVAGADVAGFGQAGQTCGDGSFQVFRFSTTTLYNPFAYTVADLEVAGLTNDPALQGDSCGAFSSPCTITATPEPTTVVLALTGFTALAGLRLRRRRAQS